MKNKSVFQNIVLIIFLNFIVKPFWVFGIDRVVQNQVGNASFGIYGKYLSLTFVFSILLDLGLSNFNQKSVASNTKHIQEEFPSLMRLKLILALVYVMSMHILFFILGNPFEEYPIFLAVLGIQIFNSLAIFIRSNVSGMHWFHLDSWLSVLDKIFVIITCGSIIYIFHEKLPVVPYATLQALGFLLVVCVGIVILRKHLKMKETMSLSRMKTLLMKGLPFALITFFMSIYTRFDFYLINQFSDNGAYESGIYMAAYRLIDVASMIGYLLANILLPVYSRNFSEHKSSNDIIRLSSVFFITSGIFLAVYVNVYAHDICQLLYSHDAYSSSLQLRILIWSIPFVFMSYIFSTYIVAVHGLKMLIRITAIVALLYVIINMIGIPRIGIFSTSYSSLGVNVFMGICTLAICYSILGIRTGWTIWWQIFVAGLISFLTVQIGQSHFDMYQILPIMIVEFGLFSFWLYRKERRKIEAIYDNQNQR